MYKIVLHLISLFQLHKIKLNSNILYKLNTKMSSIAKNIVVFGGNGFLGKRICQEALSRGYLVTSIS